MPNDCYNRITIRCDHTLKKDLEVLIDSLKNEEEHTVFDFNAIIPIPPELNTPPSESDRIKLDEIARARLIKLHGVDNWKEWTFRNWGTKWNAYEDQILEQGVTSKYPKDGNVDAYVIYTFSTAWQPPVPVIFKLRNECPDFKISAFYDKPETEMAGYY